MENLKNLKLNLILKLWFFNTFTFGFVLNFISYLNSNWLRDNVHAYGLFENCEIFLKNNRNLNYSKQIFRCSFWSSDLKPKFLKYSVVTLTVAIAIHFLLIIVFFISLFFFEKELEKFKKKIYFLTALLTGSILILYGANILTFIYQFITNENKESLSFCFWFSVIGFLATLLSISFFLVNFNKNNYENENLNQDYQSIIMSHVSKRQPFEEIFNINASQNNSVLNMTNSITVRNAAQFKFKRLYEFVFERIRRIIGKKFRSAQHSDGTNATNVFSNSSKIQICPLHSLVLPIVKKNSGCQHTKMIVLPFGRLSGVHNKIFEPSNFNE